jgi:hypothetical protein
VCGVRLRLSSDTTALYSRTGTSKKGGVNFPSLHLLCELLRFMDLLDLREKTFFLHAMPQGGLPLVGRVFCKIFFCNV